MPIALYRPPDAGGPGAVPSKDYSRWPPRLAVSRRAKGDGQDEQQSTKKKTMKTNTTIKTEGRAQEQSEQVGTARQQKWNLYIGDEPYGFVHATSQAEALDRVAAFKRPFRAVLAPEPIQTNN